MKVTVSGTVSEVEEIKDIRATTEVSETAESPKEEEKKNEQTAEGDNIFTKRSKGKKMREGKRSHSKGHESPRHWSGHKKEKIKKMRGFFNEIVTKMVDERINHMLPCLKERILKGEEPVAQIVSDLVHNGVDCKGCAMKPINGIRYKCSQCVDFNLCGNCEEKIEHEHPLLKIKKIFDEKKEKEGFHEVKKMFKKFFKHQRESSSSASKDKCHKKWEGHAGGYYKKIWGLAHLYGGEPDQYSEFAKQHHDLKPMHVFKKYAEANGIPDEEFKKKFVEMRCQKLSGFFGKKPEEYRQIVEETIELPQKELMDTIYEKGIEKREDKRKCWWGRRFHFDAAK